ncbi:uncharacterized protein THITE_36898 [Thermothielavioides terrestris NRRL 8126]|uniref:SAP domain-containing protein n=1 Tax=Thermothielavioides terrestris (strain ATCC 38088 / NRRL 8126) TaxID=578455 RepID=G2R2K7_THETT|nr:uncharacterized protein THITE_36898 [Thermothielavioides terrestris NRRL 8126]AEO66683.1 hypothetical protein THITE_36898 [Thermothielavioides terrestris NRRL 8126]
MATDFSRLTVVELRQELKRRNLPQTGKKADLVDRLMAFDKEHGDPDHQGARDSPPAQGPPAESQHESNSDLPAQASPDTYLRPSVSDDAPPTSANNHTRNTTSTAESSGTTPTLKPANGDKVDETAGIEPATVTEIFKDSVSRKRRSRSPPPENDSTRKRARPSDQTGEADVKPEPRETALPPPGENLAGSDTPSASAEQAHPAQSVKDNGAAIRDSTRDDQEEKHALAEERTQHWDRENIQSHLPSEERKVGIADERLADYDREVAPSQHPATPALYIKNFMRPLRESVLRDYLIELAAFPGVKPDPDCVVDFYLDQIRTHAFVRFTSISAASRVRTALHGTVWPDERNRKELWVDFIPEDKVVEWADREQSEGGRGSSGRWEVLYEPDDDGIITARLVNAEMEPARRNSTRQPLGPPPVPTGPARNYPGVEGAPSGPRGRGTNHYRQAPPPPPPPASNASRGRDYKVTRAYPPLQYRPASEELAQRRLANMNYHITKDRHRDLGRPDEINRYTFEDGDLFVDRGEEAFIGIRPPHRERERRRLGIGRGNRGPAPRRRTPSPRRPSRDDDSYRGSRGDYHDYRDPERGGRYRDDVPRSRFDGQPLPTFTGGGRGGRRGGGGRRDRY